MGGELKAVRAAPTLGALEDQLDKLHRNLRDIDKQAHAIRARLNGPWPTGEDPPGTPPAGGVVELLLDVSDLCLRLTASLQEQLSHIGVGVGPYPEDVPAERTRLR